MASVWLQITPDFICNVSVIWKLSVVRLQVCCVDFIWLMKGLPICYCMCVSFILRTLLSSCIFFRVHLLILNLNRNMDGSARWVLRGGEPRSSVRQNMRPKEGEWQVDWVSGYLLACLRSRDSVVGTATGYMLDNRDLVQLWSISQRATAWPQNLHC